MTELQQYLRGEFSDAQGVQLADVIDKVAEFQKTYSDPGALDELLCTMRSQNNFELAPDEIEQFLDRIPFFVRRCETSEDAIEGASGAQPADKDHQQLSSAAGTLPPSPPPQHAKDDSPSFSRSRRNPLDTQGLKSSARSAGRRALSRRNYLHQHGEADTRTDAFPPLSGLDDHRDAKFLDDFANYAINTHKTGGTEPTLWSVGAPRAGGTRRSSINSDTTTELSASQIDKLAGLRITRYSHARHSSQFSPTDGDMYALHCLHPHLSDPLGPPLPADRESAFSPPHDAAQAEQFSKIIRDRSELVRKLRNLEREKQTSLAHHEARVQELEDKLDEALAELSTRRCEIEKLKTKEKLSAKALETNEKEMERLAHLLSEQSATQSSLKRSIDAKDCKYSPNIIAFGAMCPVGAWALLLCIINHSPVLRLPPVSYARIVEIMTLKNQIQTKAREAEKLSYEQKVWDLQNEIAALQDVEAEVESMRRDNEELNKTIKLLKDDLELARNHQDIFESKTDSVPQQHVSRGIRKLNTLRNELLQSGVEPLSPERTPALPQQGYSDGHAVSTANAACQTEPPSQSVALSPSPERSRTVKEWLQNRLAFCSPDDLLVLREVWNRVQASSEGAKLKDQLRTELLDVVLSHREFGAVRPMSIRECIRRRKNDVLNRILEAAMADIHQSSERIALAAPKVAPRTTGSAVVAAAAAAAAVSEKRTLAANSHSAMVAILLYTVVVFLLGMITTAYLLPRLNRAPVGPQLNDIQSLPIGDGQDVVQSYYIKHVLAVDDMPPQMQGGPRPARFRDSYYGQILIYWLETLLWDEKGPTIPT
ncbi:hypothetical protein EV182_000424 [Spiromyces aspiralis]|uniref:Uncharacterized protein n=1 Tax=Spiromyces aspiralis TaxID=68401 RepID=A0ACC1HIK1_9FUNG|nr:hypothetical protein EV182_000424 [Spiromyces aspiralis]